MTTIKKGHNVKVHYKGTLKDGTEFDNSKDRGSTLNFQVGSGQMIKGFDNAVKGMGLGEVKTVTLTPSEAYGEVNPDAFRDFPKDAFPTDFEFKVGETVHGASPQGQPMIAKIAALNEETVTLDLNHPLAGENLTFEIEVIEVDDE